MLRLASYDIVFQEVPDEVTLALILSGCPNKCKGCHSPHLRDNIGEPLDKALMDGLIGQYGSSITCVCFMGGDGDPAGVEQIASYIRSSTDGRLKTAWYSGRASLPAGYSVRNFDYLKLGPYVEQLGGLDSEITNQRFYKILKGAVIDLTPLFRKGAR